MRRAKPNWLPWHRTIPHGADQARQVVLQALLHTVPVVGAVTMLRVRRSRSRAQLRALLPEVQARLSRPRHLADARLVIQRVEALLSR